MLTSKQQQIFDYICQYTEGSGYPPSYNDIAVHFGFSTRAAVKNHLDLIEKKGYIRRDGKSRTMQVLKPNIKTAIPILGHIAAGTPILAVEDHLGTIDDITQLKQTEGRIALKIKGDSMINAHIDDGDLVIIQTGAPIKTNDIAAVQLEDEATLKRVVFKDTEVHLIAENERYAPIIITRHDFNARFIGKFIALVRTL